MLLKYHPEASLSTLPTGYQQRRGIHGASFILALIIILEESRHEP